MSDETVSSAPALPETPHQARKGDCRIAFRPAGHILQILQTALAAGVPSRLNELAHSGGCAPRSGGPATWWLVGHEPLTPSEIDDLSVRLGPQAWIVDQTHGRVRIEISGPGAVRLLATGTAIDLSLSRFPIGSATETLYGHIGLHLARTADERFELLVGRSYALSLWDELTS
jgi:sarcosine oxidase, subunit gamma